MCLYACDCVCTPVHQCRHACACNWVHKFVHVFGYKQQMAAFRVQREEARTESFCWQSLASQTLHSHMKTCALPLIYYVSLTKPIISPMKSNLCVYTPVRIHGCVHSHVSTFLCICKCVYMNVQVYVYTSACACMSVCKRVCIFV